MHRTAFNPAVFAAVAVFFAVPPAFAAEERDPIGGGALMFATGKAGHRVPAPLLGAETEIRITGTIARVHVRQSYINPSSSWVEAKYVFPLPETAAVDRMRVVSGDRELIAEIREREAARKTYETARQDGRRAALVEQHRPNVFSTALANIAPKAVVNVEISYLQTVRYDQGRFSIRYPMAVGPRYMPRAAPKAVSAPGGDPAASGDGWMDAPVRPPRAGKANPMTLTVHLDAGLKLTALSSPHHRVAGDGWEDGKAEIRLADVVPADRDFELVWTPETDRAPRTAFFTETKGDERFVMAMVMPPRSPAIDPPPRDVIFVLDRSGSMDGPSIAQARKALVFALDRLRRDDRFEIIRFSHRTDSLFGGLRPATGRAVRDGKAYVRATRADGGTEMRPALLQALAGFRPEGRLRQIVFLTDGAVGNEAQLLDEIATGLKDTRIYTIGIGSAPNSYFMRRTAEIGRGSFTHIGNTEDVAGRMKALILKIERPAMTGLSATWDGLADGAAVLPYPDPLPDLHDGEPVLLFARLTGAVSDPDATLSLAGTIRDERWRRTLDLAAARPGEGIATLWARARIHALTGTLHRGADRESVRQAVIATALKHHVVSRHTSLIAVEEKLSRPVDEPLFARNVPLNLPDGWKFEKIFGVPPAQAVAPAQKAALQGTGQLASRAVMLPQGATDGALQILLGLAALVLAGRLGGLCVRRRT